MHIFVTGATGFLGSRLVRHLLSVGESVRAMTRSPDKAQQLLRMGAEPVVGDITDRRVLEEALQDVGQVYHLAGKLHFPDVPAAAYHHTHVEGTDAVLKACLAQGGLSCFVHVSTTGVIGATGDEPAGENAPYAPRNAYEQSKLDGELLARQALVQGLPVVIARPGLVYGPGDVHLLGLFRTIQRGLFRPIGRHSVWLHPIYISDMTQALICCGTHPDAIGECFNIAGAEPVTIAKLAATIATALGKKPPRGRIPMMLARAVAGIGDLLPGRLKTYAPLTSSRLDFLTHSRTYDVSRAQRLLGFLADTDLSWGIARTVDWYLQQGYLSVAP